jgi:hypothetical protein
MRGGIGLNRRSVCGGIGLVVLGAAWPVHGANLLVNPGFEAPAAPPAVNSDVSGWTFVFDAQREHFVNHTPGGTFGIWGKTFQPAGGGIFQNVGITAGANYSLTSQIYFESAYPTTSATTQLQLTWMDAGNNPVGSAAVLNIAPASVTTTGAWTPFTLNGTAPAGASQVQVFLGWNGGGTVTGAQSIFFDDADLEGPGTVPNTSTWVVNGSGDWNLSGNWANGTVPNGVGAEADFFNAITASHTVYSDIPVTVGTLNFNNARTYVLGGAGTLTLQASSGNALVIVQQGTQKINLPTIVASNTVLSVAPGATLVVADPLTLNAGKTLTQTGGGTVTYQSIINVLGGAAIAFGNSAHAHELNISAAGTASVGGAGSVLTVDTLSNAGTVDVRNNALVVSYGTGPNPAATLRAQLRSGAHGGLWDGTGVNSSFAAADARRATTLGFADNGSAFTVMYTWYGDANLDGIVNGADRSMMSLAGTTWSTGDFNNDGVVNGDDFMLFSLGATYGTVNISTLAPEPGIGLAMAGGLLLARLRRSRNRGTAQT